MNNFFLVFFTLLFLSYDSLAAGLINKNENDKFSAHLENVQLVELTTFIQEKYGIAFKNQDTSLLEGQVTVSFQNIDLEQMLKKILTKRNFVFKYNNQGKVIEVTLMTDDNKKTSTPNQITSKNPEPQLSSGFSPASPKSDNSVQNQIATSKITPPAAPGFEQKNSQSSNQDKITSFKVVPNSPPPENDQHKGNNQTANIITSFKAVPNASPPGK